MLTRLAILLHAHGRRVLLVSVIGAAIAGAFGVGVAKHLSPYGATDPATQSVQAGNRFQHAASHQIDAGVVHSDRNRKIPVIDKKVGAGAHVICRAQFFADPVEQAAAHAPA